ncbi:Acyl-CoA dehydrogenase [Rosistilla carotiformis]|uniref:Acyl-CoA dehydrogenase n=1 Tax=Rosistilla carotiformis TaxID=2528017 RepID=A0A518JXD5_9BACT|nr:acyl-CoA dehydrogenase family protein [Rosistilla carotiformis]QDV70195.1 Acyl-CoA dehydrogenase [Rosistilla carotiformis]
MSLDIHNKCYDEIVEAAEREEKLSQLADEVRADRDTTDRSTAPAADGIRQENGKVARPTAGTSFAETALRLGGKSDDEARRTGVLDTADDQVEALFAPQYQTANSPIHRSVWERRVQIEMFALPQSEVPKQARQIMDRCLNVVRTAIEDGTIYNDQNKLSDTLLQQLGQAGYWGMLVDAEYGGSGLRFQHFAKFITEMATIEPTVAGLASVHGCIGAVDPLRTFGNREQKERFLPGLADGSRLSAFALTEPGAGSDLTALRTTAVLDGDDYVVNGEKLFITNAVPGRTIGLVCKIDDQPAVLIAELPTQEDEHFQMKRYGLYALRRAHNNGLVFRNFRVPAENLLRPLTGDGLTIAYHGLNLGRVSLCANAAGTMRSMLASMLPWAAYRRTYGQSIDRRELVQRRIGHMAGLIVGCDALTHWCGGLIDMGYRGEMECTIAKIFGSEALKEAAIELYMKTHGGRSFLHGHTFGDNVHEFLAPCIYEGEGEMLGMAFFKSLVKQHGKDFFEPIGRAVQAAGIQKPNPANPLHAWHLKGPLTHYARWYMGQRWAGRSLDSLDSMPSVLRSHAHFAQKYLADAGFEISGTMRRFQLQLADRQCAMAAVSQRLQDAVVILCTSLYGSQHSDPITQSASDVVCWHLRHRLRGSRPTSADFRRVTELGESIADEGWSEIASIPGDPILMRYYAAVDRASALDGPT